MIGQRVSQSNSLLTTPNWSPGKSHSAMVMAEMSPVDKITAALSNDDMPLAERLKLLQQKRAAELSVLLLGRCSLQA